MDVPSVVKRFESSVIDRRLFLRAIEGTGGGGWWWGTSLTVTRFTRSSLYLPAAWQTIGAAQFAC